MQNRPNSLYETLTAAQALIADRDRWTQGAFARIGDNSLAGPAVSADNAEATCWCSLGAIYRVTPGNDDAYEAATAQLRHVMDMGIDDFNDTHEHAEVMLMWDKARELALQ